MQKLRLNPWGFAAAKERWKVTVKDTAHGMMVHLKHLEASGGPLRQKHNCPNHTYELSQEQATSFRVQSIYKQSKGHTTTSYYMGRELAYITYIMSNEEVENSPWFLALPHHYNDVILKAQKLITIIPQPEPPQAAKHSRSPRMPKTKKKPPLPEFVRRLPWHQPVGKSTMIEKGKTVIIHSEEEIEESPTRREEEVPEEDPV